MLRDINSINLILVVGTLIGIYILGLVFTLVSPMVSLLIVLVVAFIIVLIIIGITCGPSQNYRIRKESGDANLEVSE